MTLNRHHRYRSNPAMRDLLAEVSISASDLIQPIFVSESLTQKRAIESLPEIYQWSLNDVLDEVREIVDLGIKAVILFGIPEHKDAFGSEAENETGIVQQTIKKIKAKYPNLIVIADCCLCEYTDHGHCGIMKNNTLDNDGTLSRLERIACSYAKAGADIIAPSGMMDGMVAAIRDGLDADGYHTVSIMSYAVKYASSFYGPFRDAAGSAGEFKGDRKHHQMNPSVRNEAFLEAESDVEEGADFLMVKPGVHYLDIIRDLKNTYHLPIVSYHVSGEYAMLKAAAKAGILDEKHALTETLLCLKRAGSDLIVTYAAKQFLSK